MTNTAIKLATIQTGIGEMALSLEDRDGKRVLIARAENGTEEIVADQPQAGYAAGNAGIADALENIQDWYSHGIGGGGSWELQTLVDWRDYVDSSATAEQIAEAIADGDLTLQQAAQKTGWPVIEGYLVPEPEKWTASDESGERVSFDVTSGEEAAQEYVDGGEWGERNETTWITVSAWRVGINAEGEEVKLDLDSHRIELEPIEPECSSPEGHDWQSPYGIVGGIKENPGVVGHGGGVITEEVCVRCGCGKTTDTWAQDPYDGEQGLTSVAYEPDKYAKSALSDKEEG